MAKHPWPDQRWPKGQDPLARYQEWADNRYNPGHWLGANTPPDTRGLWSTRDRHWLGWAYTAGGTIGLIMAARIAQDIASFVIVAGMLLEVLVPGVLMLLGRDSSEPRRRRRGRTARAVFFLALAGASTPAGAQSAVRPKYVPKPGDFAVVCTLFKDPQAAPGTVTPEVPITYDAHFIIGARVERTKLGTSPWSDGTLINFVIHSPTMLYGGRAFSGHKFVLTFSPFTPTTDDDKVWFAPETRYILRDIAREPVPRTPAFLLAPADRSSRDR